MLEGNDAAMEAFVFYRDQIYIRVWSGFFNEDDLDVHLEDLSHDAEAVPHLTRLEIFAHIEMASKRRLETMWPARTDWDRLDAVFQGLERANILCLHDAGHSVSDAYGDASDIIVRSPERGWRGFAYYHGQDIERAVYGRPLFVGFDAVSQEPAIKRAVGQEVAAALRAGGFEVRWDSDPESRLSITNLDWKKRTPWARPAEPRQ